MVLLDYVRRLKEHGLLILRSLRLMLEGQLGRQLRRLLHVEDHVVALHQVLLRLVRLQGRHVLVSAAVHLVGGHDALLLHTVNILEPLVDISTANHIVERKGLPLHLLLDQPSRLRRRCRQAVVHIRYQLLLLLRKQLLLRRGHSLLAGRLAEVLLVLRLGVLRLQFRRRVRLEVRQAVVNPRGALPLVFHLR